MKTFSFRKKKFDVSKEDRFSFDKEVKDYLPPIPDIDYEMLKEDLKADGLRHAITVWREEGILIDGYHRYFGCISQGLTVDKIEYLSFSNRDAMFLWVLKSQNERRGSQPPYWRCVKALNEKITKALKAHGEAIKKVKAKVIRAKQSHKKPSFTEAEEVLYESYKTSEFDARKEQLKLAGTTNPNYLEKVRFVEDHEEYWNDVVRELRENLLKVGGSHSVTVDDMLFHVSLEEIHRQTKTIVRIIQGFEKGTISEKAFSIIPFKSRMDFLQAIDDAGEEDATQEIQEEVAARCHAEDDFDLWTIHAKFTEVLKEKEEEKKKKKKKKEDDVKKDIEDRIEKLYAKLLRTKKKLDDVTEDIKIVSSNMSNLLRKATEYEIPHDKIYERINEKTAAVFRISAYCLVEHLKEMFGTSIHGKRKDDVKFLSPKK